MQKFYLFQFLATLFLISLFGVNAHAQVPVITSFSPASGAVGSSVTLTGTSFNTTASNDIVFFGSTMATVTSASATSLTVTVPTGSSYQRISVTDITTGLTAYSASPFDVTYAHGAVNYASHIDILAGSGPWNVAIGDLDGDGKADVVVTNLTSGTISIYRNNSSTNVLTTSSFTAKVDLTTGTSPQSVAIADLDGDGKPDIIVSNAGSATVSVFRNLITTSGSITSSSFATKVDFTTGTTPYTVAVGDIDGDGKPDLVTANSGSTTISLLRNTSTSGSITSGSFATKVDFTTGATPRGVVVADLDGDGKADVAVTNNGAATVSVFRNTATSGTIGTGSLAARINFTVGSSPNCIAVGDLDGDGKLDLAVSNYGSTSVSLLLNTATSGSITATSFAAKVDLTTASSTRYVAIGDLDGDGKPDVIAENDISGSVSLFKNKSSAGTLSFNTKTDYNTLGTPEGIAVGDLNGDGQTDIAVADNTGTAFSVLRNLLNNSTLAGITLSTGTLSPVFAATTTTYTATVNNATTGVTVAPALSDANATVKVNGTLVANNAASGSIALSVGANTVTILVTAQDATTTTYTLTVTRSLPASTNANLASLSLSDGTLSPAFAVATTAYTASVPNTTTSITVTPTVADATATVAVNGTSVTSGAASAAIPLNVGTNTITTIVTAEDAATTVTYTTTVTRAQSSNAGLASLTISVGTLSPAFATGTTSYTASVSNTTTNITVTPTVADATASVTVNGTAVTSGSASGSITLALGTNTITTVVTAQNGATNTYTLTVTRALSSNAKLTNLAISGGALSPVFATGTNAYTAGVANTITSVTVTPTVSDANATVKVNGTVVTNGSASGNIALSVGANAITTLVTAQDGTTNTYTITVTRAASSDANLTSLALNIGTLTPVFSSATTSYAATVPSASGSITITPAAEELNATILINGTAATSGSGAVVLLPSSSTVIATKVTAQDGTVKIYTLTITKTSLSTNANLASLTLSSGGGTPAFASGTTVYTASVSNAIASVTITPTAADATATIKVNGTTVASGSASGAIALSVGANTVTTIVTAQDGVTQSTYTLTITRAGSSNADLSGIALSTGSLSPAFAAGTVSYTASVSNATNTITITPTLADATASIKVNNVTVANGTASSLINLAVGTNLITISTTAQDGTTQKSYSVTVTRAPSSNADLASLALSDGTLSPAFSSATATYTTSVANSASTLTITPALADATASIKVNGTTVANGSASGAISLNVGSNTISIAVTAQDGATVKTTTITVTRAPSSNANLSNITLSAGSFTPTFSASTNTYTGSAPTGTITVTPTLADLTATVKVNGIIVTSGAASAPITISNGSNGVTIIVTAQDGTTTNTYTLTLTGTGQPQVITFPTFAAVSYGSVDFAIGASSSNTSIPLTYTSSNTTVATIVNNTIHVLTAGSTTITVSQTGNSTYVAATPVAQTLTVSKAPLTITANNQTKVYGVANPSLTLAYAGFVNNETSAALTSQPSLATSATATSAVGTYAINASSAAAANYAIAYVAGSLNVTPATLTVTAADQTKTYGSANPAFSVNYSGFVGNDNASTLTKAPTIAATAITTSPAGTYPITASGATAANYTFNYVSGTLTVNKAPLTITAVNQTRAYGAADPVFTATYTGFVGTDSQSSLSVLPIFTPSSTATSTPGNYSITPSGAIAANYSITYVAGVLTIVPSTNTNLASLSLSVGNISPAFSAGTTTYTDSVGITVDHVNVTLATADPTASVTINGVPANNGGTTSTNIALNPGYNPVKIVVTAQDGSTERTYNVLIYRAAPAAATGSAATAAATNIMTPNGDGKNDQWVIKDILNYPNNQVTVYDRAGRTVFSQHGYANTWDGSLKGAPLTEGTYYYTIDLGNNTAVIKGFITIFRNR